MIRAIGLSRSFGPTQAVRGLDFSVEDGEVVGFLGPNGAGKTTTMRMLTGTLRPSDGRVEVGGVDMAAAPLKAKAMIGYLPERPPLDEGMRVADFLEFAARLRGVERRALGAAVDRAVERAALGEVRGRLVGRLSKGYRQRVGLAQALVHEPAVLILDEPTSGLDPEQIREVRELIRALKGEHTVLLSTHVLSEVTAVCDRVLIIDRGRLVAQDRMDVLGERARGSRRVRVATARGGAETEAALQAVAGVSAVRRLDGAPASASARSDGGEKALLEPAGAAFLVEWSGARDLREALAVAVIESGAGLLELVEEQAGLDEVFLETVRRSREDEAP